MSKGSVSQKDKAMAAYLKEIGHKRTSARCPICNQVINLNGLQSHIAYHR